MKNYFKLINAIAAFVLLNGCAGHVNVPIGEIVTLGLSTLPKEMQYVNHYATIHPDFFKNKDNYNEQYFWDYSDVGKASVHRIGITLGTPNETFRVVPLMMNNWGWISQPWLVAGIVPDQIPELHAWDVVEVRMLGVYSSSENFTGAEDASIITRVVCYASDPNFENCIANLPSHPKDWTKHLVPSGTKYLVSAQDYGYTFTPRYTHEGKLRSDAAPLPIRPFPVAADYNEYSKENIEKKKPIWEAINKAHQNKG